MTAEIQRGESDLFWTKHLKSKLIVLGNKLGYITCTAGFLGDAQREWLYDLVWYKNDEKNYLQEVPLVMESEWGRKLDDIKYDFEKLLMANCEVKLMICQDGGETLTSLVNYFESSIKAFKNSSNACIYIIAVFENENYSFYIVKYNHLGDLLT